MKLYWLPKATNWSDSLKALSGSGPWTAAVALANSQLDFIQTNALDEVLRRAIGVAAPVDIGTKPVRLAILSSCTTKTTRRYTTEGVVALMHDTQAFGLQLRLLDRAAGCSGDRWNRYPSIW